MGFLECAISDKHRDNALNISRFDSPVGGPSHKRALCLASKNTYDTQ